uniref:Uncharacterized protein n=1 Tax=Anguilla anguilla TaxID=7936 RepID=A0A0E9SS17_ANGAN
MFFLLPCLLQYSHFLKSFLQRDRQDGH